ncbi:MAG: peptidase dimerization domain-containing protein [Gemmatimonadota bacterium]|nr:peptidase dimerization domain-containing protein [Gemmatimonadota bacterium]MDH3424741.1 peptidase dimerization domain-containing protein [Gemmatimonadota bacterium]
MRRTRPASRVFATRRLLSLAFLLIPLPLLAQTTATERAAARDIVRQIDELQARLDPTGLANELAGRADADRDALVRRTTELWESEMQALSDFIGHNPEVGWEEFLAVDTLTAVLENRGWDVEVGVAGLETAFVATWTSPAGPQGLMLGLIGEYDALRDADGPFHGDQHNAQTPIVFASAFAMAEHMAADGIPGRIRIYGTPAEEVGPPAKVIMHEAGVFDGADILIRSHGVTQTSRAQVGFGSCCLNINEVKYTFLGTPSHQMASWHGRNALAAAVHFFTMVDGIRSTLRPEASIQGVITEGGDAPNVVPQRAVLDYYIRYPDPVYLEHISKMMDDAARGAAMATGTEVEIDRYGEYRDGISLGTLQELSFAYAKELGAPNISPEPSRPSGYEETGVVTKDIPGIGISVFSSRGANHTRGMLEDTFNEVGHTGFRISAEVMSSVLYDFLTRPDLREAIGEEHRTLAGLLDQYHEALREAYASELGGPISQR